MPKQIIDYLDANGDGTGDTSIAQNGSVTAVIRKYTCPTTSDHMKISRIRIYGEDGATTDADGSFLNLAPAAALANGLGVGIYDSDDDSLVLNLLAVGLSTAKNNSDFVSSGWDYTEISYTAGDSIVFVQREFADPLIVDKGQYIGVVINDNLSAFTAAHASIVGRAV